MIWYLVSTLLFGITGVVICVVALKRGQFEDLEDVKYQLFHEDEE